MLEGLISPSKTSILDAAEKLLGKYGYAGLSMRELAEECGLAKATIYHYFHDKQAIVLSVLERDMSRIRASTVAAAAQEENCIEKLRAVIQTHYVMTRERHAMIINVIREINGLEPHLQELKRKHMAAYYSPVVKIIEDGIAQGLFRPVNVEMTVFSLFGMIHSFVAHCMLTDEAESGDDFVDHTLSLLLYGINQDGASTETLNSEDVVFSQSHPHESVKHAA
ncbi:MAG: TetR/AcrR family transcriptional regulator [Chloroflexi bacterium]|nr:TetR/AcrR family transcriptional regulator [Chloroflexota bacterium]